MRAAFLTAFSLVGLVVPADLVAQKPKHTRISYEALASYNGLTFCTTRGVYSVIAAGLSALDEADVKAHEAKHREQYARFISCAAFQRWYARPVNRLDSEAEAYAAGYCVQVAMGADPVSVFQSFAERIQKYTGGANRLDVIAVLRRYTARCP